MYDDYLNNHVEGGRAAWVVDALRCLITGLDVETIKSIIRELTDESNGLLQFKNPFEQDEKARSSRSHLLLINVIILFDSKKTVGQLVRGKKAEMVFRKFRENLEHQEPNERWTKLCNDAEKILKDPQLTNVKAKIAAEVQVTFDSFSGARHDMYVNVLETPSICVIASRCRMRRYIFLRAMHVNTFREDLNTTLFLCPFTLLQFEFSGTMLTMLPVLQKMCSFTTNLLG